MKSVNTINDLKRAYDHDRNLYAFRHARKISIQNEIQNHLENAFEMRLYSIEFLLGIGKIATARNLLNGLKTQLNSITNQRIIARYYHTSGLLSYYNNHIIEALESFETSMNLSNSVNDLLQWENTKIWREIALIHFYEPAGLDHMQAMIFALNNHPSWEKSMLCAHFVMGAYRLKKTISSEQFILLDAMIDQSFMGPYVMYLIGLIFLNRFNDNEIHQVIDKVVQLSLKTQGIKGDYRMIDEFVKKFPYVLEIHDAKFAKWYETYINPIIEFVNKDQASLFSNVPDEPKVSITSCLNCDNRCCYDGVYVTYSEEAKIKAHIQKYPDDFKEVPDQFLEDGEWEFLFGGKRTKRVFHEYLREDYPAHFEKTICIFALKDGSCSLQRSAIKHHMHPWSIKPELCWKFPLIGLFNEDALNHPHYFGEKDPHYYDEHQPGYLSFLPCSKVTDEGISWKQMYRNELQYYLAKIQKTK